MNKLYFGDNLGVLRERISPESVDLIYLDPPFNSNANYNVLFSERSGAASEAQAEAFRDTWEWGEAAASAYEDVMRSAGDVGLALKGLKSWIGQNAMMAYLAMMAARLLELRDVLKPTGSLYLHCDPTASHYLKTLLDAVFCAANYRAEICWERTNSHNMKTKGWTKAQDTILFYTKSDRFTFNTQYAPYGPEQLARYKADTDGRLYKAENLTFSVPNLKRQFNWRGSQPPAHRSWGASIEQLEAWYKEGRILLKADGTPRLDGLKVFLDDMPGKPVGSVWTDIRRIGNTSRERLGYPTQKPVALLERIISASSNPGDMILDPFCGCGTTVEAAARLDRRWVGIDVTHYAITLIEARLKASNPSVPFTVHGRPTDFAGARDLARRDKHQFQWWAAWRVGSQTYREEKKGADRGIDGNILFKNGPYGDGRIIVSVKGGDNVGAQMVRDLRGVIEREDAEMGILVTLANPTGPMMREANDAGFMSRSAHGRLPRLQIVTVEDILFGKMPKMPPLPMPERKLTPSIKRKDKDQLELLLPFEGEKIVPSKGTVVDPRFLRLIG